MRSDPHSPLVPARVRALVLPLGRIKRSRFLAFYNRLKQSNVVSLRDLPEEHAEEHESFSSKTIVGELRIAEWLTHADGIKHGVRQLGMIVYDYTLSGIPEAHSGLIPFELFRESLVVIGIGDAQEYASTPELSNGEVADWRRTQFLDLANSLHEQFPRALIQRVLLFDEPGITIEEMVNDEFVLLPQSGDELAASLPRIVHDMTIGLRREFYNYSKSIQTLPSIASPSLPDFQPVQPAWHGLDSPTFSRRDSSFSQASNASTLVDNKNSHRMSMPVLPSNYSSDGLRIEATGKPSSPKTFDEMASSDSATSSNPFDRLRARPLTIMAPRSDSQDRVSIHGFGSDSFSEKTRHKGLGRIGVVNSGLLLLAGRWDDALKEAVDCAVKARSFSDHIWYAKALELVAVSMVLLAWSGLEFQIPSICYTTTDPSAVGKAPSSPKLELKNDLNLKPSPNPQAKATFMKMITSVMPSMTHMIHGIYGRPNSSGAGEAVPQFVLSESALRMSKLLTVMNQSGGTLTDDDIAYFILGQPRITAPKNSVSRLRMHPSRRDITNVLLRALPDAYENSVLMPADHAIVLAGVSAVYSLLGMQRKRGMMMKELLSILLPVLQQARVAGAAEAGIHPSASASALALATNATGWELETGIGSYLNAVCQAYDIPVLDWSSRVGNEILSRPEDGTGMPSSSVADSLVGNFVLHAQGGIGVKAEVLRICIQICEALSDAAGIMHYSAALLRTAGPGTAPAAGSVDALVALSREEQIQLATTIFKTAETAGAFNGRQPEVDYWDEFIVRGFYLLEPAGGTGLQLRKKSELKKVQANPNQPRDPFIHNPFLDKGNIAASEDMLCANEQSEFVVLLQNPYEFEVEIESLHLMADTASIEIDKKNFTLRPSRTQSFSMFGRIADEGVLNISACNIKIKGCRARQFPIFSDPWTPQVDTKIKNLGFCSELKRSVRDSDLSQRFSWNEVQAPNFPIPTSISLKVIPEQPILVVQTTSVPQNSLMLLEGESTEVSVTIANESSVPADFMLVSTGDTATEAMQEAITQKGIHPAEMYEIEYQMSRLPVIKMASDQPTSIPAHSTAKFTFTILAKAGLSSAYLQFDYANLSTAAATDSETFYTKRLKYVLDVTVNASILLHRLEIVSLPGDFTGQLKATPKLETDDINGAALRERVSTVLDAPADVDDYCLMLLDLRNSWPSPLTIDVSYATSVPDQSDDSDVNPATSFASNAQLQPGQIVRQILLIPKIYLRNSHQRIKPLSPAHQRQFIVSTDKFTPEIEIRSRECFWFREALLEHLVGSWTLPAASGSRTGAIDLRAMRLSARMLDDLRISDVKFDISAQGAHIEKISKTTFSAKVDTFFTITTTLRNKSAQTIYPFLRLRPSLADQPRDIALDLSKRFAWSGVLQRPLAALAPGAETSVTLPVRALAAGEYAISASVEEIIVAEDAGKQAVVLAQKDRAEADLDDFVHEVERRTWTAPWPCVIRVCD